MSVEPHVAHEETGRCPVSHDFDPFGEAFQTARGAALRTERAEQPVFYNAELDAYVVTRHADVRAVMTNPASFSSRVAMDPMEPLGEPARAKLAEHGFEPLPTLLISDEPEHMRRRRRLSEPFSPEHVAEWEPRVREIFDGYIDAFVARGSADLVAELCFEGPAIVALEFMGVPHEDMQEVKQYAQGLIKFLFGRPDDAEQVASCDLIAKSTTYAKGFVGRLLEDAPPAGDGLLQYATREHLRDPQDLERPHLESVAMSTLAAAHETTSASLASALLLLLEQRESWEELCADESLIPNAVEECLRLGLPLSVLYRLCVQDATIGGVPIPAGAKVMLALASANDDEALFEQPDAFDIHRPNARRHLAFGTGGHVCLGARLARLEMCIVLQQLTRRLPHMRLVEGQQPEYLNTASVGGPLSLYVEWDPAANPLPQDRPAAT